MLDAERLASTKIWRSFSKNGEEKILKTMKIPCVQRPYGSLEKLRSPQPRDNVDI